MLDWDNGEISTRKISIKLLYIYLVQQFYSDLDLYQLIPTENRTQGLFKTFAGFSSNFQGIFNFQRFSRKLSKFEYFSNPSEPCTKLLKSP